MEGLTWSKNFPPHYFTSSSCRFGLQMLRAWYERLQMLLNRLQSVFFKVYRALGRDVVKLALPSRYFASSSCRFGLQMLKAWLRKVINVKVWLRKVKNVKSLITKGYKCYSTGYREFFKVYRALGGDVVKLAFPSRFFACSSCHFGLQMLKSRLRRVT